MKHCIAVVMLVWGCLLTAAVPGKMPVQGVLRDSAGDLISDDAAEVTFTIYDAEEDGTELWTEDRTLFIEEGRMNVYLGELEPLTYAKIGGQNELWLSVTYDGEEMSRIQLGAVPYAVESQYAQQAGSVGKYNENTLDDLFVEACPDGSYLRGWTGTTPICQTDESGGSGGGSYTAGYAIVINGSEISVDQSVDFYTAGTGIDITDGVISVSDTLYALSDHNHDGRYYLKETLYTQSELNSGALDGRYYQKVDNVILDGTGLVLDADDDQGVKGRTGSNDYWHVYGESDGENRGSLVIETEDDGEEPIIFRQWDSSAGGDPQERMRITDEGHVNISNDLRMNHVSPVTIRVYNNLFGGETCHDTFVSKDKWSAAIIGFNAYNGDINEIGTVSPIRAYMDGSGDTWKICVDFATHNDIHEYWMIHVMYVHSNMACDERKGDACSDTYEPVPKR